jgi:hypothetical protein
MGCEEETCDDAEGYRGLQFELPALEAFSKALSGGQEPEELQLLYRAWAAGSQQQVSSTAVLCFVHLSGADSMLGRARLRI